jgi:hypothetical protein
MLTLCRCIENLIEEVVGCLSLAILIHQNLTIVNQRANVFMSTVCIGLHVEELCGGVTLTKPEDLRLLPGYHSLQGRQP